MTSPVLVLLGSLNADDGSLSGVALSKCRGGLALLQANEDWLLLPTGGFGEHFNRSSRPHWTYVRDWFLDRGVAASRLLGGVDSFNTMDDAVFTEDRLQALYPVVPETRVLTCAYHLGRAKWIFDRVFEAGAPDFLVAPDPEGDPDLERLVAHEPVSLAAHRDRWEQLYGESLARLQKLGATR
jgi:hypothetical protein